MRARVANRSVLLGRLAQVVSLARSSSDRIRAGFGRGMGGSVDTPQPTNPPRARFATGLPTQDTSTTVVVGYLGGVGPSRPVVAPAGAVLVRPPPLRPRQHVLGRRGPRPHQPDQQPPHLGHTQRDQLRAPFFTGLATGCRPASPPRPPGPSRLRVTCRCHPAHDSAPRTRPARTSPLANFEAGPRSPICAPATRTKSLPRRRRRARRTAKYATLGRVRSRCRRISTHRCGLPLRPPGRIRPRQRPVVQPRPLRAIAPATQPGARRRPRTRRPTASRRARWANPAHTRLKSARTADHVPQPVPAPGPSCGSGNPTLPYTASAVTHARPQPQRPPPGRSSARPSTILVANATSSGTPASSRRSASPAHSLGRYNSRSTSARPLRRGVPQEHPDLAVLDPPGGARVLPPDATRPGPLLEEPGLIDNEYAPRVGHGAVGVPDQVVAGVVGRPVGPPEQVLDAVRPGVASPLGQLPTRSSARRPTAARGGTQSPGPRLRSGEVWCQHGRRRVQLRRPCLHVRRYRLRRHATPPRVLEGLYQLQL